MQLGNWTMIWVKKEVARGDLDDEDQQLSLGAGGDCKRTSSCLWMQVVTVFSIYGPSTCVDRQHNHLLC